MNPKFIIEDNCLIMAKCVYHKDLALNKNNVKGGGWFKYDAETNTFIFYGESVDFGKATIEDIGKCIESGNVYKSKLRNRSIIHDYNYSYDTGTEIIKLK